MDASEVAAAVAGGADIVDVKDPAGGPLGAPAPHMIHAVRAAVFPPRLVSAALGDAAEFSDTLAAVARGAAMCGVDFVKVGLVGQSHRAGALLRAVVEAAGEARSDTRVVAVAYADAEQVGAVSPFSVPALAAAAGAHVVMLDTAIKNGNSLLAHLQEPSLSRFIAAARDAGLWVGLAGSLGAAEIERVRELEPDVVGVRGSACRGGRVGRVDAALVKRLRQAIRRQPALSGATISHSSPGGNALGK